MKYKVGDFIQWKTGEMAYITSIEDDEYNYIFIRKSSGPWQYPIEAVDDSSQISLVKNPEKYKLELL